MNNRFGVITGASSGIGYELAAICAREGFDLLIAADRPEIHEAAQSFRALGPRVDALELDLADMGNVERLYAQTEGRAVDAWWLTPATVSERRFWSRILGTLDT